MQTHPSLLSAAVTLGTAMCFGAAAIAADPPTEGTFGGTTAGNATYRAVQVGKERLLLVVNDFDATTGNGLSDHTIANCFGLGTSPRVWVTAMATALRVPWSFQPVVTSESYDRKGRRSVQDFCAGHGPFFLSQPHCLFRPQPDAMMAIPTCLVTAMS
jgi:hypothetical protein